MQFKIKLSADRKVQQVKREKNSFGIPAIKTCPGSTEACIAVCYATSGFFRMPNAKKMYQDNFVQLKTMISAGEKGIEIAANEFVKQIKKEVKGNIFRWNIGGDIFKPEYLEIQVRVAEKMPDITFWTYTRSFDEVVEWYQKYNRGENAVPKNFKLNLSFDRFNIERKEKGVLATKRSPYNIPTYMGPLESKPFVEKELSQYKWITCPVDIGKLPLQSGCVKCKLCFADNMKGKIGIYFPIKKRGKVK